MEINIEELLQMLRDRANKAQESLEQGSWHYLPEEYAARRKRAKRMAKLVNLLTDLLYEV